MMTLLIILASCTSSDNETVKTQWSSSLQMVQLMPEQQGSGQSIDGIIDQDKLEVTLRTQTWRDDLAAMKLKCIVINGKAKGKAAPKLGDEPPIVSIEHDVVLDLTSGQATLKLISLHSKEMEYTVILKSPQTTGLPIIKIEADNGYDIFTHAKSKEYAPASVTLIDNKDKTHNLSQVRGGIRGRGNSTWPLAKKPLRIKFDDKQSLMGLPKEKSWVLLANHLDPTFLMNTVAFELAKRMELEYTNTDFHVELFHNGEYMGNYQLTEQVQVKKDRVNVDKKTGFLVELDIYFDDENKFRTDRLNMPIMIKHPEEGPFDAIKSAFNDLEEVMCQPDFADADLSKMLDLESFAKFMLVFEVTRNTEIEHPKSVKLYRKSNKEPIKAGPVWDFDWAFGYTGSSFNYFNNYDKLMLTPSGAEPTQRTFFKHLLNNKAFLAVYKQTWNTYYQAGAFDLTNFLVAKEKELLPSVLWNKDRWKKNYSFKEKVGSMREWLSKRVEVLNTQIPNF